MKSRPRGIFCPRNEFLSAFLLSFLPRIRYNISNQPKENRLEEGIRKMLTDEAYYARLKAGAEKRSAYFDGKRMIKEIEDMFVSLVETT